MNKDEANRKLREAIVAGIFYPEEPVALRNAVELVLADARPIRDDAIGILSPHAGFAYTGALQALAWKAARGRQVRRVVIVAPHHRGRGSKIYLPESRYFQTPLGDVAVDSQACEEIESCGTLFETNDLPHLEEHAIEVQLPFMKQLFPEATLIPMIVGGTEVSAILAVARAIELVLGGEFDTTLIVVSSNVSSSTIAADSARQADDLLDMVCRGDWHGIIDSHEQKTSTACGCNAIAQLMASSLTKGTTAAILGRSDSRKQDGDLAERVVQYAAVAWFPGG